MANVLFFHRDSINNCEKLFIYFDENVAPSVEEVSSLEEDGQWVERYTLSSGEERLVSETVQELTERLRDSRDGKKIS